MNEAWANKEFFSVDLGDERLNKRLLTLSERFSQSPLSPINHACDDWAETKAAYRFFSNEKINYKEIIRSHTLSTKERCLPYSTVLAIQDTTFYNFSQHPQTKGLCPLTRNKGINKADIVTTGLIMHSTFMVGSDGLPLGLADQKNYSRPQPTVEMDAKKRKALNDNLPIEEKDSYRWVESLENTVSNFAEIQSRIVTVCDREADMYDLFLRANQLETSFVVRAKHDRSVNKKTRFSVTTGEKLWSLLKRQKCEANIKIKVPKQNGRNERTASCEVKYSEFVLNIPHNFCEGNYQKKPTELLLYAVYVSETNCPENYEPLEWMLMTNIAITTPEQALEKVEWYCLRWRIETWHKIIKSGLQVEDCRLSTSERLIRYLTIMSIVAWRIFWVTIVARVLPDAPCSILLNEFEWKILAAKFGKSPIQKQQEPTLEQSIRWIAQLGGFLARKNDRQPGITHIWRGMKKFAAILEGADLSNKIVGNR